MTGAAVPSQLWGTWAVARGKARSRHPSLMGNVLKPNQPRCSFLHGTGFLCSGLPVQQMWLRSHLPVGPCSKPPAPRGDHKTLWPLQPQLSRLN